MSWTELSYQFVPYRHSHCSDTLISTKRKGCLRNKDTERSIKWKTRQILTSCHPLRGLKCTSEGMAVTSGHHTTRENWRLCRVQLHWRAASIRNDSKQEDTPEIYIKKNKSSHYHMQLSWTFWRWNTPPAWNQDHISSPSRKGNNQELSSHFAAVTKFRGTQLSINPPRVWPRRDCCDKQMV